MWFSARGCAHLGGRDPGPLGQHSGFLGTHRGHAKTLRPLLISFTRRLVTVFSIQPPGSFHSLWHFPPSVLLTGPALQRAGRGTLAFPLGDGGTRANSTLEEDKSQGSIPWGYAGLNPSWHKQETPSADKLAHWPGHGWPHELRPWFLVTGTVLPTPALGRVW